MHKPNVRLVLVSSDSRKQAALSDTLESQGSISVVAAYPRPEDALAFVGKHDSDVVLSDIPPGSARDVLLWRQLREKGPAICILTRSDLPAQAGLCCLAGLEPVSEDGAMIDSLVKTAEQRTLLFEVPTQVACTISRGLDTLYLEPEEHEIMLLALQGATNSQMRMLTGMSLAELEGRVKSIADELLRQDCAVR